MKSSARKSSPGLAGATVLNSCAVTRAGAALVRAVRAGRAVLSRTEASVPLSTKSVNAP